jgi:hypothetical protein
MDDQPPAYRREFLKSPHHAVLGLATLGVGFMLSSSFPLALLLGVAGYVIGWIYLPDLPLFHRWVDGRRQVAQGAAAQAEVARFMQQRDALLSALSASGRKHYQMLAAVCHDIESASADSPLAANPDDDPRLRKLDELMWTFLRLLSIEDSLNEFLETERSENVPGLVKDAEAEVGRLSSEYDSMKAAGGNPAALESRQRLLNSKLERLDVLRKRQDRIQQAESNLTLVVSEEDRLEQQIKLVRADAIASKNADTLTARIDATVEHLDETNKWLSELSEFKDLVGEMPASPQRIGYSIVKPPLLTQNPANSPARGRVKEWNS